MKSIKLVRDDSRLITNNVELMPMERLEAWYLACYVRPEASSTAKAKRHDFDSLRLFMFEETGHHWSRVMLGDLTEARLQEWQDWMLDDFAASTINRRFATIRHFCKMIKDRVPTWHNPATLVKDLPLEDTYRAIPEEHREALVRAAYHLWDDNRPGVRFYRARAGLMVEIACFIGLRAAEILGLTPGHISRDAKYFLNVRCKGRKYQNKYIHSSIQQTLASYLPYREEVLEDHYPAFAKLSDEARRQTPLFPTLSRDHHLPQFADYKTIWKIFAEASEVVSAGHFSPHSGRHAYVEALVETHKDPFLVAQMVGHANVNTTMRYAKRPEKKIEAAAEAAFRRRG